MQYGTETNYRLYLSNNYKNIVPHFNVLSYFLCHHFRLHSINQRDVIESLPC